MTSVRVGQSLIQSVTVVLICRKVQNSHSFSFLFSHDVVVAADVGRKGEKGGAEAVAHILRGIVPYCTGTMPGNLRLADAV